MNAAPSYDAFLSYSRADAAIVHALAERLRGDGVAVWLDAWVIDPGAPIGLEIQRGLEASAVLLMCMSKEVSVYVMLTTAEQRPGWWRSRSQLLP